MNKQYKTLINLKIKKLNINNKTPTIKLTQNRKPIANKVGHNNS